MKLTQWDSSHRLLVLSFLSMNLESYLMGSEHHVLWQQKESLHGLNSLNTKINR